MMFGKIVRFVDCVSTEKAGGPWMEADSTQGPLFRVEESLISVC